MARRLHDSLSGLSALHLLTMLGGGVSYLLYDSFSTALAAGAVNGTFADTGQTRTVVDTNSKLSITGGVASFATGGSAVGNPGLYYPSMARQAGLTVLGSVILTTNVLEFGFDTNQSGVLSFGINPNTGGGLSIIDFASFKLVGAGIAAGVTYQLALSLKGTGCYFYIRGGVFTSWMLLWISIQSNAAVFPAIISEATTDVFIADNIRVPIALFIPQPLAYDTFTRANGALGSTETSGPDSQVLSAIAWAFTVGIWTIVSNAAVGSPASGADAIVNGAFASGANWSLGAGWAIAAGLLTGTATSADATQNPAVLTVGQWYRCVYTISAFAAGTAQLVVGGIAFPTHAANATYTETGRAVTTAYLFRGAGWTGSIDNASALLLTTAELFSSVQVSSADVIYDVAITLPAALGGVQGGAVLNLDSTSSPANFILVYLDGRGNLVCEECVAGVYGAAKFTTAITYSAGATLRVIRDGTSLRAFYNNAAVSTVQTMTSNVNTRVGNFSTSPLVSFDNVLVMPRGTGGEYSGLDSF